MPCATPTPPEFSFVTDKGAAHNLEVLKKYNLYLGKALKVQQDSPLGNVKEFKPPSVLLQVFGLHPLWNQMDAFLSEGSKLPLVEIRKNEWQQDLVNALTFGNHKGTLQKPVILKKLIAKDIEYRYSLPLPLSSIQSIPGLVMAPMNIMAQNTIDEFWANNFKRQTHSWPELEMVLCHFRKQPHPKGASSGLLIWLLHLQTDQLGNCNKAKISRSADSHKENWL
jgi:hypothetical protein